MGRSTYRVAAAPATQNRAGLPVDFLLGTTGYTLTMEPNPALARWLLDQRSAIEDRLARRLGPAAPRPSGPEAETLRRFRTFATTALMRGQAPTPALEGLRPDERRVMALLTAWRETAIELAGLQGDELAHRLSPLLVEFRLGLRTSAPGKPESTRLRTPRRAVSGAIDRIADAFLAIDVSDATIVDANPAAGALLGVERDSLFGLDLMGFVPSSQREAWWGQLDALAESEHDIAFEAWLNNAGGDTHPLAARARVFQTRSRTLALLTLRSPSDAWEDTHTPHTLSPRHTQEAP
ncbi:MAG: PAS domain-containing protein [Myxococcota bacterium]|nr:PAS domain-containing protein [Myxococcota bacterium]